MKKIIFSTILFLLFISFITIFYLSFFGYETDRFNKIIQSEIQKSNNNINLNFKKISILLDIKKLILFVKFIQPNLEYRQIFIPLRSLRTDIDLEFLTQKKLVINKVIVSTKYLDFNAIKPLLSKIGLKEDNFVNIKNAKFRIKDLKLEFDKNFKLKRDFNVGGDINTANIKISNKYEIRDLIGDFLYEKNSFYLNGISWNLNKQNNTEKKFFDGQIQFKREKKILNVDLKFKAKNSLNFPKIPLINYSFSENSISEINTQFSINKNKTLFLKNLIIENNDNKAEVRGLNLDKNYNLINFNEIYLRTSKDNNINNEFKITNEDKIRIKGKVFDAKLLIKELSNDVGENKFLKKISRDVEIDFDKILKGAKFPIKNFRLIGKIKKGSFEKISAKSDFMENKHFDISLKKKKNTDKKILEVYSDIATPLLSDYEFFQGLDGGNLNYTSNFDKKSSSNLLIINNFKLNKAPALAKILTLADLKGLTDTLKGEGISFDTLSIKFQSNSSKMDIEEIFMIGPSISILIDGYVEKPNGLISLRGTLVPAKTLNSIISKIPVIGDILISKKVGEGLFGISFKIKGLPDNLKTTVNPVKTLTPRFITRALEAAKKKEAN